MLATLGTLIVLLILGGCLASIAAALATDDDSPCDDEDDTVDMPAQWWDEAQDTREIRRTHPR